MKTPLEAIKTAQDAFADLHKLYGMREYELMFNFVNALADAYHLQMLDVAEADLPRLRAATCAVVKMRDAMADRTGRTTFLM